MTARAIVLLERDGADVARWALAAAIVLAAHLGLMATYLLLFSQQPHGAPETPAVIIELAPLPVATASPMDVAPGPEMMEAQPPPEPQVVEPPPPEPLVEPPPLMVEPLVALPEPPKQPPPPPEVKAEPQPKPPEVKRVERNQPAPRTTAAPRSERNTAETAASPSRRQRQHVRGDGVMARPGGFAIAARQALSERRAVAARAGRRDAQLHAVARRQRAGAEHREELRQLRARPGGAGDGDARAAVSGVSDGNESGKRAPQRAGAFLVALIALLRACATR